MPVYQDITNTIGRAPLVELQRITASLPWAIATPGLDPLSRAIHKEVPA